MRRTSALVVVTAVALAACQDQSPESPQSPEFTISDGAHTNAPNANPDFFYLPPMVPNPSGHPNFDAGEFNAKLAPVLEICELADVPEADIDADTPCATEQPALFPLVFTTTTGTGSETVRVSIPDEHYIVNWHTKDFALSDRRFYRIAVRVGAKQLGFADIDVVNSGKELKNVNTGEFIALKDGRTLPIKFRIENAALCDPPGRRPCASQTINLPEGGTVTFTDEQGTIVSNVDFPPQPPEFPQTTITIEECEFEIDRDLPRFPPCLTITADPAIPEGGLAVPGVLSVCTLEPGDFGVGNEQERLVTLHRKDDAGNVEALPHAEENCPVPIGSADGSRLQRFARAIGDRLAGLVGAKPLYARRTSLAFDVGGGGEIDGDFSDFQFFLPAQMFPIAGTKNQSGLPSSTLPINPGVRVLDEDGVPVIGATVRVQVTAGGGSVDRTFGLTDQNGEFRVVWTLGATAGTNTLRFFGNGIADPDDPGPFMPDIPATPGQNPVSLETGEVLISATAIIPAPDGIESGFGSAVIDGQFGEGEWDAAATVNFLANLPGGGTTPATLLVMNDQTDIYLAVRFAQSTVQAGNSLSFEFDNDNDGVAENGDDVLLVNPASEGAFKDEFRTNSPPCTSPGEAACGFFDTSDGGTNDGAGAFGNNGAFTLYEMSHPLNSGDVGHDFALAPGDKVGMFLSLRMIRPPSNFPDDFGDTNFPGFRNYLEITLARPALSIVSVNLNSTTLTINQGGTSYSAIIANPTTVNLSTVVMQGWVDQGETSRAAGGTQVVCGPNGGVLPPGNCTVNFTIAASDKPPTAGSGLFSPGSATARFELKLNGEVVDELLIPITLVLPVTDQVNDPQAGTSFGCGTGGGSLYQGFTPGASPLTAISLRLRAGGDFPSEGFVRTSINVRAGSPTGAILASASAFVRGLTAGQQTLAQFLMPSDLAVTPGNLFVIEWPSPGGELPNAILTWMGTIGARESGGPYAGGTMFGCGGSVVPDDDLNFITFTR